jgi:hypothetical protein
MINTAGAVTAHKKHVKGLIRGSTQEILVRLPAPVVSSGVNPLFGDFTREDADTGTERGPYKCLWYDALSARSMSSTGAGFETTVDRLAGQYREATAFAEMWLEDVLVDPLDISGHTWFDRAQTIVFDNMKYDYLGNVKIGLSTSAPYILLVVLKGGLGYAD